MNGTHMSFNRTIYLGREESMLFCFSSYLSDWSMSIAMFAMKEQLIGTM